MDAEPKTISFEVARIQEIGQSLCEVGEKHKASSFGLLLSLVGEICCKYHRDKTSTELAEVFSRIAKEPANG